MGDLWIRKDGKIFCDSHDITRFQSDDFKLLASDEELDIGIDYNELVRRILKERKITGIKLTNNKRKYPVYPKSIQ